MPRPDWKLARVISKADPSLVTVSTRAGYHVGEDGVELVLPGTAAMFGHRSPLIAKEVMNMKTPPTYDDANLILELYKLRREDTMRAARKWFAQSPAFTSREQWLAACPPGSEPNAHFRMVTSYWEMAATFVATGVLNAELFYRANNIEMLFVWEKVRQIAAPTREVSKNALYWRNLEDVANGFIRYMNENAPGWYEVHQANIAKIGK